MRNRTQVAKGIGLAVLILLALTYALLGLADGWSNLALGWVVLFLGIFFACALAAPIALQLLREGLAGLRGPTTVPAITGRDEKHAERQLLEAIERYGKITPARAALETTLTVAEADRLLSDLARKGYLEVRIEGGKLIYTL